MITGVTMEQLPVNPFLLFYRQQRVVGDTIGLRGDMVELLRLAVATGIRPLIETYPLDEVNAAHKRVRGNKVRIRAVLSSA